MNNTQTKIRGGITECASDRVFHIVTAIILILLTIITIYPLYFTLIASVSDLNSIMRGEVLLTPKGFNLMSYERVFQNVRVISGYRNSIIYAAAGTLISLAVTFTGGYALSYKFPGKSAIMLFFVFTMFFSGGLIHTYFNYYNLHMLDTIWVIIIPGATGAYSLVIARTFISQIPVELREAADMDGCSKTRYFFNVVLPLSTVIIAIQALFSVVGYWNSYFNALMFVQKRELQPLTIILREILIQNNVPIDGTTINTEAAAEMRRVKEILKYSLIVVASVPMLILYPFLQKYFVKGVLVGSIKG